MTNMKKLIAYNMINKEFERRKTKHSSLKIEAILNDMYKELNNVGNVLKKNVSIEELADSLIKILNELPKEKVDSVSYDDVVSFNYRKRFSRNVYLGKIAAHTTLYCNLYDNSREDQKLAEFLDTLFYRIRCYRDLLNRKKLLISESKNNINMVYDIAGIKYNSDTDSRVRFQSIKYKSSTNKVDITFNLPGLFEGLSFTKTIYTEDIFELLTDGMDYDKVERRSTTYLGTLPYETEIRSAVRKIINEIDDFVEVVIDSDSLDTMTLLFYLTSVYGMVPHITTGLGNMLISEGKENRKDKLEEYKKEVMSIINSVVDMGRPYIIFDMAQSTVPMVKDLDTLARGIFDLMADIYAYNFSYID